MPKRALLLIILTACLCYGCQRSPVNQQLDLAEAIMEEYPDSALTILQQIDGSTLRGEPQARHALLLSQAYDKNYIDQTSDSLISIATSYYNNHGDKRDKLMAGYYNVAICMNRQEYYEALSSAFDVEKLAEELKDSEILAKIRFQIARAYFFSFNLDGAKDYYVKTLDLIRQMDKPEWMGLLYADLSNLALLQNSFPNAFEYADLAKTYLPDNPDIAGYEMLAHLGMDNYDKSIYTNHLINPSTQAKVYKLLAEYQSGNNEQITDSLSAMLSNASHMDSIDIAYIASHINRLNGDFEQAWKYTDFLLQKSNDVINKISAHSISRLQLEHEKAEHDRAERQLHNTFQISLFIGIIALIVIIFSVIYFKMLRRRHEEQITRTKDEALLIASEFAEMQANLNREIDNKNQEVISLNHQIHKGRIAAQELFMSKYAWIEELGNIFIDAELSKTSTTRAMNDLKKRLDTVKTRQFIDHLIEVINKYCNNLINRVKSECPAITESERTILALLCANLSTRIISFILNIKPQSIYNAKYSIKRKLEKHSPSILQELGNVCM